MNREVPKRLAIVALLAAVFVTGCGEDEDAIVIVQPEGPIIFPSQSGTIQMHPLDSIVYALNTHAGTLGVLRVLNGDGADDATLLAEIAVGSDPQSVSIHPSATRAYVSNGADSTISVVDLGIDGAGPFRVAATIQVGSEPRGTALSPSGSTLYVANFADGSLSVIDTATNTVVNTRNLQIANPFALAVTNDRDGDDADETLYVTDFFGRGIPTLPVDRREGFDDGKEGRVVALHLGTGMSDLITLSPMASGFNADRSRFCTTSATPAVNDTYCEGQAMPGVGDGGTSVPTDAFFNQLHCITVDQARGRLFLPAIGASPEPPVNFNTNVQALVGVVDTLLNAEMPGEHVNLNVDAAADNGGVTPTPPFNGSLVRTFMADTTHMAVRGNSVLTISRAGSFAVHGTFDAADRITLQPPNVTRFPTGNLPNGVVMNSTGTRGYVNAGLDQTVTILDLTTNQVVSETPVGTLPTAGSQDHNILLGELAFFTGLGLPATELAGMHVRDVDTRFFRNMASDNNWSSCASCHPFGSADGVTWIFPTGPRQTVPLEGSFSPINPDDQRVFNWNAVRGSITDFNNNARNVQGGEGFTPGGDADAGQVFNHGPNQGVSEALDLMTLWVQNGIRIFNRPSNINTLAATAGRTAFGAHCADCHGGAKWTSSRVRWEYPLFLTNPVTSGPQAPLDPRVLNLGVATVLVGYDESPLIDGSAVMPIVTPIGTLDGTNPIEIRGAGGLIGQASAGGAASFNPPSLLNVRNTAPYGHHGRAGTLADVFEDVASGGLGHPTTASPAELTNILEFLRTIDGREPPF